MKYIILIFMVFMKQANATNLNMRDVARHSLEANIVSLPQGEFLAAGANQFGSLWTRDFCYSVPALLTLKRFALVKNQLTYLIDHRRSDGLVPIYADSIDPMKRVILGSVNRVLGTKVNYKITKDIKPFYAANGKYPTIDANILVLKASYEYSQASKDNIWWNKNKTNFQDIYNYYTSFLKDGLIVQGDFSDWQDSAKRSGKTFLTNLQFLEISKSYHFLTDDQLDKLSQKIHDTFYDSKSGLYFSVLGYPYISLDGILWAIEKKLMPNTDLLYKKLKQHPLWNNVQSPGFATFPSYQRDWLMPHVVLSELSEYHGNLSWSWLMAYSSLVAFKQGDYSEASKIYDIVEKIILRDQSVGEIYFSKDNYEPFKSRIYKSETPFSWGAAFVIKMQEEM
jgi:glycogen debranching enzyme